MSKIGQRPRKKTSRIPSWKLSNFIQSPLSICRGLVPGLSPPHPEDTPVCRCSRPLYKMTTALHIACTYCFSYLEITYSTYARCRYLAHRLYHPGNNEKGLCSVQMKPSAILGLTTWCIASSSVMHVFHLGLVEFGVEPMEDYGRLTE